MRTTLTLLIILAYLLPTQAAPMFAFWNYKVEDGLSNNCVNCGFQDSLGFIWFGTNDGLNCFDGKNNQIYRNTPSDSTSLGNAYVLSLTEDHQSNLWIGTNFGCYIYQRDKGQFIKFPKHTTYGVSISCEVKCMHTSPNGLIWMGTLGQGTFVYDPKTEQLQQDSKHSFFINDFYESASGDVYATTLQGSIIQYSPNGKPQQVVQLSLDQSLLNQINCIAEIEGKLWMSIGDHSLYILDTKNNSSLHIPVQNKNFKTIHDIFPYHKEQILMGTDNGLYIFNTIDQTFTLPNQSSRMNHLSSTSINGFFTDAEKGIWILTKTNGVSYLPKRTKEYEYHCPTTGNKNNLSKIIGPFCKGEGAIMWFGTKEGLFYLNESNDKIEKFPIADHGKDYEISSLWYAENELWVGTNGEGVKRINLKTGQTKEYLYNKNIPQSICGNHVTSIYQTSNKELYIGTTYGLCRYLPETDNFQVVNNIGFMMTVTDMYEDHNHVLWFATLGNGLYNQHQIYGNWKHYKHIQGDSTSLTSNFIHTIFEDKSGKIWLGTNGGGLCMYNDSTHTFSDFDPENEILTSQSVYSIEEDDNGYFWLANDAGLICINPNDKKDFNYYSDKDGLQSNRFTHKSSIKSSYSKRIYFGGDNGFNSFLPQQFDINNYIPPIYVTDIKLQHTDGKKVKDILQLQQPIYSLQKIKLPYRYNSFSLALSSLSYQEPSKNSYSYILHGIDKGWITGVGQDLATYTNLSPGTYKFEVKGSNNNFIWNPKSTILYITITPPWYRTTWMYILYILIVLSAIAYSVYRMNKRLHVRYNRKMTEFKLEQEKKIYQNKIDFFVNLVHEIRTPLSLIHLPLEALQHHPHNAADDKYITTIQRNVDYLLGITNELLDFQKMEHGGIVLNKEKVNLSNLIKEVKEQFIETAHERQIDFQLFLPNTTIYTSADKSKIQKILINLLSNAFKFTNNYIAIKLQVYSDKELSVSVIDNGNGLSEEDLEKVFKPFYQTENGQQQLLGTGLGLAYSRSLARAHEGELTLQKAENGGCCAILTLPLKTEETPIAIQKPHDIQPISNQRMDMISENINKKLSILLVEDNADLLTMTSGFLKTWYKIYKATNGTEALEVMGKESIDIIVSDVMMPVMDGLELCKRIKENINYSHIPVILLTAKTTIEAKVEGMESGADAYLEKPFSIKQLHHQIENILKLRLAFHRIMQKITGSAPTEENIQLTDYLTQKDCEFIERINIIIDQQLADESLSLDILADSLNMSRSSFYRKFKALTGSAPNDYLKTIRLNKAAELLKTGMRISEVHQRVGFNSSSYFAKCFKAQFGVLPKEYASS